MKNIISICYILTILSLLVGCSANSTRLTIEKVDSLRLAPPKNIQYKNYWEAMQNLALVDTALYASTEQREFSRGLRAILNGDTQRAKKIFDRLSHSFTDSLIVENSRQILGSLLFADSDWRALFALDSSARGREATDNTTRVLVHAFRNAPGEEYHFTADSCQTPLSVSKSGSPVVTVEINGVRKNFWIDTGAGLSVISSDVAEECGISPRSSQKTTAGTATSKRVNIHPALIDSLKIGELTIRHHPAIIIDKKDLEFKLLGFIRIMKIDGIIGWNAIKHLTLTLDYSRKIAIFKKPIRKISPSRNFFWLGYPLVLMKSGQGVPLCFGLDTGARRSSITRNIFNKITVAGVESRNEKIGGAGGFEKITVDEIPEMTIYLNSTRLRFENIKTLPPPGAVFFTPDGVLGSDVLKNSIVIIDYPNGRFIHSPGKVQ